MAAETLKKKARFSCKCVNIQINASKPAEAVPPELAGEPGFTQVYVKQDGITAAHPQLTLRIRSKATPVPGTHRFAQYLSMACLICRTLVYRVHLVISTQLAAQEGPVIPKSGWVEEDVLHTPSGWIEVFEDVLTDELVARQQALPQFSPLFALVLPPLVSDLLPTSLATTPASAPSYLADMEPLFSEISTTSNPVSLRLTNIASEQSKSLRAQAEREVSQIVKSKIAQVAQAEHQLRLQVHTLLQTYEEGLRIAEEEGKPLTPTPRPWKEPSGMASSHAAVSVTDFVPAPVPPVERVSPETPRVSILSASIATSTFHHPRAVKESPGPASYNSSPLHVDEEHRASSHGGSLLDIKRKTDEELNTAASYRYFVIEEEMARLNSAMEHRKAPEILMPLPPQLLPDPPVTAPSLKPKRKVTFDLKATPEEGPPAAGPGDMVFDIEDETGEDRPPEPLHEPSELVVHLGRPKVESSRSLSLVSSLRPSTSLPPPSLSGVISLSPSATSSTTATGQRIGHSRVPSLDAAVAEPKGITIKGTLQDELDIYQRQHDDEIMKVLAAGTPSHRAAWSNGGKAWGEFLHRGRQRTFDSDILVGEDDDSDDGRRRRPEEEDEAQVAIPGSMPIRIKTLAKKPEPLSLTSYRPQTISEGFTA